MNDPLEKSFLGILGNGSSNFGDFGDLGRFLTLVASIKGFL